ncbi:iojap-like protein [Ligilactobacillus ruminis ATCC 25644]|jgi:ribosome-associated protein|uniref:Ribosomal silencing factor RsfS n=2 Tax=Ligilactobacillus ruminis TaxID=1623 RepID=E7FN05_9LACO|nr:iojap-like protein [Ligilactobacillus ruminis ATCC 25644]
MRSLQKIKARYFMDSKELLKVVVEAADSKRAEDIVALDVQGISLLADYFVIMQANSERQVKAIADIIEEKVEEAGFEVRNVEGKDGANWILLDLGDVVVHVFKTETRQFYNLEKLWSDAPLADIDDWIKE